MGGLTLTRMARISNIANLNLCHSSIRGFRDTKIPRYPKIGAGNVPTKNIILLN